MTRQFAVLLVFLPFFATVAPATVLGEDTVYVQNIVLTETHTGGQGLDGADGTDGADGADGQPGQAGQSVNSGESRSTAELFNSTNNEFTSVQSQTTGSAEVYTKTVTTSEQTLDDEQAEVTAEDMSDPLPETPAEQRSKLLDLIATLQKLIEHYVNALF